ncbi:MAG: hypothetical protein KAF27_04085 [Porphyrobacter sp.]|nr:hypothetical protein [Porphyrobacter sp.]
MLATLLLPLSLQGSVLAQMSDEQFCDVFRRNVGGLQQPPTYPVTAAAMSVDCAAKKLRANMKADLSGPPLDVYVNRFLGAARAGVCNLSDPTMAAFHKRGWKFAYKFEGSDGSVQEHVLTC